MPARCWPGPRLRPEVAQRRPSGPWPGRPRALDRPARRRRAKPAEPRSSREPGRARRNGRRRPGSRCRLACSRRGQGRSAVERDRAGRGARDRARPRCSSPPSTAPCSRGWAAWRRRWPATAEALAGRCADGTGSVLNNRAIALAFTGRGGRGGGRPRTRPSSWPGRRAADARGRRAHAQPRASSSTGRRRSARGTARFDEADAASWRLGCPDRLNLVARARALLRPEPAPGGAAWPERAVEALEDGRAAAEARGGPGAPRHSRARADGEAGGGDRHREAGPPRAAPPGPARAGRLGRARDRAGRAGRAPSRPATGGPGAALRGHAAAISRASWPRRSTPGSPPRSTARLLGTARRGHGPPRRRCGPGATRGPLLERSRRRGTPRRCTASTAATPRAPGRAVEAGLDAVAGLQALMGATELQRGRRRPRRRRWPSWGCACAVDAGDPWAVLRLLDRGRGASIGLDGSATTPTARSWHGELAALRAAMARLGQAAATATTRPRPAAAVAGLRRGSGPGPAGPVGAAPRRRRPVTVWAHRSGCARPARGGGRCSSTSSSTAASGLVAVRGGRARLHPVRRSGRRRGPARSAPALLACCGGWPAGYGPAASRAAALGFARQARAARRRSRRTVRRAGGGRPARSPRRLTDRPTPRRAVVGAAVVPGPAVSVVSALPRSGRPTIPRAAIDHGRWCWSPDPGCTGRWPSWRPRRRCTRRPAGSAATAAGRRTVLAALGEARRRPLRLPRAVPGRTTRCSPTSAGRRAADGVRPRAAPPSASGSSCSPPATSAHRGRRRRRAARPGQRAAAAPAPAGRGEPGAGGGRGGRRADGRAAPGALAGDRPAEALARAGRGVGDGPASVALRAAFSCFGPP